MNRTGPRGGCTLPLSLIVLFLCWAAGTALAQTPNPVTPGYQICSTASGSTQCSFQPVDLTHPLPVSQSPVPFGATALTASGTGTTSALATVLAGVAGKTTYVCGFTSSGTATAAIAGNSTLSGTISGTMNFTQSVGTSPAVVTLSQNFSPCVPASAVNTAITFTSIAPGAGGVISNSLWGFQQ